MEFGFEVVEAVNNGRGMFQNSKTRMFMCLK